MLRHKMGPRLRAGIFLLMILAAPADSFRELEDNGSLDTCEYDDDDTRCGDMCIEDDDVCQCGSQTFRPLETDQYCCLPPGGSCTEDSFNDLAICNEGRILSMSTRCENPIAALTCHNAYQVSEDLGHQSYFSCPQNCVHWSNMCRGVNWCQEELAACGSDLKCIDEYEERGNYHDVDRHHFNSSSATDHHYCLSDAHINNRQYDSIQREDEKYLTTQGSARDIDITSFTPCNVTDIYNKQ